MTREEIQLLDRISRRLVAEKDPDRFANLMRELDDLLQRDQNSREQNQQNHAPKYSTAS
jgi:hypothetical protein